MDSEEELINEPEIDTEIIDSRRELDKNLRGWEHEIFYD